MILGGVYLKTRESELPYLEHMYFPCRSWHLKLKLPGTDLGSWNVSALRRKGSRYDGAGGRDRGGKTS